MGGSPQSQIQHKMEDYKLIANKTHIMWVFYIGPVSDTTYSSGYNPNQHEGWCIPLRLFQKRDSMSLEEFDSRVFATAKKLRVLDDGTIRRNYNDTDKWWILAPTPNQNPTWGIVVRAQEPDRAMMNVVPYGGEGKKEADLQQRAAGLRASFGRGEEQKYPEEDDVWVETMRIKRDGSVEFLPRNGSTRPLAKIYKELFEINSQGSNFNHEPRHLSFGNFQTNPMSQEMPSTVTMPVQTYIPAFPEFLTISSLIVAVASYLNENGLRDAVRNTNETRDITPTEYIDYEDLKREAQ